MSRTASALLSTENLLNNLRVVKSKAPNSKIIAMVKANAYGHGIRSTSLRLDGHVDMLGVASIDEAMALRNAGVKAEILLAQGLFEHAELEIASSEGFNVVFHNEEQTKWLVEANSLPKPVKCWIKVNTGMGRLGMGVEVAKSCYNKLLGHKNVDGTIRIMSHFACADEKDNPMNQRQIDCFNSLVKDTNSEYSFCNSAAIFNFPQCHYDYVRPGIALYGVSPIDGVSAVELGLKPVMTLQTSLMSVQNLKKGSS
ncbi:MAG: alanine racemase, partial [Rickettsiaceae bacterium]|nr:alanine racemase [Rickettsiaceae bacterium]